MTDRDTCSRCGNANSPNAVECLACGRQAPSTQMIASRDLNPRDFELFSTAIRNDFNRARRGIDAARRAREAADEQAASWLRSLNSTKAYAYKHGIDLE